MNLSEWRQGNFLISHDVMTKFFFKCWVTILVSSIDDELLMNCNDSRRSRSNTYSCYSFLVTCCISLLDIYYSGLDCLNNHKWFCTIISRNEVLGTLLILKKSDVWLLVVDERACFFPTGVPTRFWGVTYRLSRTGWVTVYIRCVSDEPVTDV